MTQAAFCLRPTWKVAEGSPLVGGIPFSPEEDLDHHHQVENN
jgi:hypothetical protein